MMNSILFRNCFVCTITALPLLLGAATVQSAFGETGDSADTNDMYLPAGVPMAIKTGDTTNKFFHAIEKDSAGFVRIQKMIERGL